MSAAIELGDITVTWDSPKGAMTVLEGFDLSVEPGSFVAIVGPSGCGKSTILRVLAGLLEPQSGHVEVGGTSAIGRPGLCAWMPQHDALLPWRTVEANASLGAEVAGLDKAVARRNAAEILARLGIGEVGERWPSELSGGMRQRVAVARTLLSPAPVLLLDEPFGALDALTRREVQSWLQQVLDSETAQHGQNRTVLLVTHDVEEALLLAERVIVLSNAPARIVADLHVDFPFPRANSLVADKRFVELRLEVLQALGIE